MNKVFLLLTIAGFLIAGCSEKRPIWADEFDYAGAPDSTKWNYDMGDGCPNVCGWGNNEAQF